MKKAFIDTLTQLMRKDPNLITITADMGFSVYENMQKEFPTRFINTGVTEQASISFAAGLALSGYKVFFYAQAAFATMRCFEQVRLDVGYNFLNVKIIGVNAGFSLNQLGISHFAQEDIALMRLIPNMTVLSPANSIEMRWAVKQAYKKDGPVYIRYSKVEADPIHSKGKNINMGYPIPVVEGKDAVFFASGGLLQMAYETVEHLKEKKLHISLYSMPTIKPIDKNNILKIIKSVKYVFILEEHSIIGALGSAITEIVTDNGLPIKVLRLGIEDNFTAVTGSIPYLLDINGLSKEKIVLKISKVLNK